MSDRMQNLYEGVSLLVKLANKGPILRLADGSELEGDAAADYLDKRRARLSDDLDQFDRKLESRRPKRTIGGHALTAGSGGLLGGMLGNAVTYAASPKVRAVGTAAGILGGSALGLGAAERDLSNRQKDYDTRAEVLRQVVHGGYQPNLANLDSLAKQFRAQGASASQEKTSGLRDAVTRGAKRYAELLRGGSSEHLLENAGRKMSNSTERMLRRVHKRGDISQAELDYRLSNLMPKSDRDLIQKENLKILGARLGTGAALGAGGYGAHKTLRGQQEKTSGLRDAVTRGARRYGELLRGGSSDHLLRDSNRKLHNTAERTVRRVHKRGDITKAEADDLMSEIYMPKSERNQVQLENLKILGARLGTGAALGAGGYGAHKMLRSGQQEKTSGLRDAVARGAGRYKELLTGSRRAKPYETKALTESRDEARRAIQKRKELGLDSSNRESQLEYFNKMLRQDRAEDLKVLGTRIGTMGVLGAGLVGAERKRIAGARRLAEDIRNQVPEEGLE